MPEILIAVARADRGRCAPRSERRDAARSGRARSRIWGREGRRTVAGRPRGVPGARARRGRRSGTHDRLRRLTQAIGVAVRALVVAGIRDVAGEDTSHPDLRRLIASAGARAVSARSGVSRDVRCECRPR
jgi:hypothetical protein